MEHWKTLILSGNQAFSNEDYLLAAEKYQHCTVVAKEQMELWFDTQTALTALSVSYLNLAETQCRLGQFSEAIDSYASLSSLLREFQSRFTPSNPIAGHVEQAMTRVKQEFLALTHTYANDIVEVKHHKQALIKAIGAS